MTPTATIEVDYHEALALELALAAYLAHFGDDHHVGAIYEAARSARRSLGPSAA